MHSETSNNILKPKTARYLTDVGFYTAILFFIIGFNFSDVMVGNWYQQFLPSPAGGQLRDIYFVDSLLGFAVSDSSILKTSNSGNNWIVKLNSLNNFRRITFLNTNTGFACGVNNRLFKTTNSGENWISVVPPGIYPFDMSVLNVDTIWVADNTIFGGGVFFTSNGGLNWQNQFSGSNQNPNKIYMYNASIGYMSNSSALPNIYKTTNSGVNWNVLVSGERFLDISFVDSLKGWRTKGDTLKYTSNGGLNWSIQLMPYGGMIFSSNLLRFCVLNKDTLWGCGGYILFPNSQVKSILYRTTNGGINWKYQVPDTSLLPFESFIKFNDKNHGWVYSFNSTGIHTTNGGDTTFLVGLQPLSNGVPKNFKLYQNYPNPFNPVTNIKFDIPKRSNVKISIYDILGKEMSVLVNEELNPGTFEINWDASNFPSGVYFYKIVTESYSESKKMVLVK